MTNETIYKAYIGRFDGEVKTVGFVDGDTVQKLIDKASLQFGEGQSINDDDGEEVATTDKAEAEKTYWIVGNFKQGRQ